MQKFSYLNQSNAAYIDELFERYTRDPNSIDDSWRYLFEGLELGAEIQLTDEGSASESNGQAKATGPVDLGAEVKVADLILAYRDRGKLMANVNPLAGAPSQEPSLDLAVFGLTQADLATTFQAGKLIGLGAAKLSDIIARLRETYCGTVAIETLHIQDRAKRKWIQEHVEGARVQLDAGTRKQILKRLTETETFERFLHTRYVAQKRFSVEGGDNVIPSVDCIIETCADLGAQEFVVGMAHRGRLNVLANTFHKKLEVMMVEFEGTYKSDPAHGEGDVKYHKGYSHDMKTRTGKDVHLSLAFNPSHLEFVNPVVEGMARAKQDRLGDGTRSKVVPILIHGDAAFAGQGVCYETIQMADLDGYKTGGTIHIVINNQVGFTTSPVDSRSTLYSTDLAKMLDAPIFHVNGDDADAVWHVSKIASEYRHKFKQDVFIDLVCYRKHGHNEGDEPSFTQPLMYKKIKAHPSPREVYALKLAQQGVASEAETQALVDESNQKLIAAQTKARAENPPVVINALEGEWKGLKSGTAEDTVAQICTQVEPEKLKQLAESINTMPPGFHLHSKLARFFEARLKAVQDGKGIDWGNGEALAYASLLDEGHPVRITGQDAERGTFTHRHSVLNDFETGQKYCPLNQIRSGQAKYEVHNSFLSETGVMGFEYGYALAAPNTLTIWEGQFGDFANGAQVIIDQFITTSESKWRRMNGLVLLLPHGYEGQGPEHSSARLERFLQLAGRENIIVANLTNPAQIFHALRRQLHRDFRKPLVVMSPKSLLRHPQAVSTLDDFTKRGFQEILEDTEVSGSGVKRVLLCSGKVYYELAAERHAQKRIDVAILRVEQLYPWPAVKLAEILKKYPNAKDIVWVQEEPRNMGAWTFVFGTWMGGLDTFMNQVGGRAIRYIGRDIASSPAVGSPKVHEAQQKELLARAFSE